MNTFHIQPTDSLAPEAYPQVQEILKTQGNLWIAVRGMDYPEGADVYTVSVCPNQDDRSGYEWGYVLAQDWVDAYEGALWVLVDEYGSRVGHRFPSEEAAKKFRSELAPGAYNYAVLLTAKLPKGAL